MKEFKPKIKHVKGQCDIVEGICQSCGTVVKGKTKEERELVQIRLPVKKSSGV